MMRRSLISLVTMLFCLATVPGFAAAECSACGYWMSEEKDGVIEVTRDGSGLHGTLVWLSEPLDDDGQPILDARNTDESKRQSEILGMEILWGFHRSSNNDEKKEQWDGGRIYDPNNGKTYKSKLEPTTDGILKIRGYVGLSWFGRTTEWTPVTTDELADLRGS